MRMFFAFFSKHAKWIYDILEERRRSAIPLDFKMDKISTLGLQCQNNRKYTLFCFIFGSNLGGKCINLY